ncbi:MAG: MFS transporter [Anaerolineales bacterium]|uniref:MFS transporter n=1 Tax=Candidatus Villigracilis affinis TaxID=3140682 RepID=UPI001B459C96|nr:MFS transporter [Anaerolineales bacterium]MBK9600398.1 MFS transporter [Anaerolineales bacterium]MBL0346840.1 MFS transporter [Anaerolineales bacterium]MBP8048564.1 MFS transporter [Anaerolineales bacterium]
MDSQINKTPGERRDPYAALRFLDFRLLLAGRFITSFGSEMVSFAIAWELWLRTDSAFALGLVGLVQVVPVILLSLPAGHVADQYNRRRIVFLSQLTMGLCALGLAFLSYTQGSLVLVYLCLFGMGISRAFNDPASSTLVPETVPAHLFSSAATWNSGTWHIASIVGPAVAGLVVALAGNVTYIYLFDAVGAVTFTVLLSMIKGKQLPLARKSATWSSLVEGFRFMRDTKVILAAITLDMFAVLFGGAVALLPIYATDILNVGPQGMGIMRAAPSIGALLMAFAIAHLPPMKNAGKTLLWAVAGFGAATIIFGLSKWFLLSVLMLALLGGLDNISVVIRGTLLLTHTPDEMRGRISGVNSIFIGISNELGSFESGFAAALLGPVIAVVGGGVCTILIVIIAARIWPEMRNLKTLDVPAPDVETN